VRLLPVAFLAGSTLFSGHAQADAKDASATKLACVQASDRAQQLRLNGKFVAARDALRSCVQDACPTVVRESCSQWLGEVNASLPSIVIGAKDGDGRDLVDLKVSIDGQLVTEHLGGLALPVDPGRHTMRYEKADGAVVEEEILVGEGTKNRPVSVAFPSAKRPEPAAGGLSAAPPPASGSRGASTGNTVAGTVLAVVGAAALGTALYLDLSATSDINALRGDPCAKTGTCSASRVNSDQLDYDLAGVGVGVGVVALGVATYVFLAHPFGKTAAASVTARGVPAFRVIPAAHGGGFALTF
jgi:hypothetical protein